MPKSDPKRRVVIGNDVWIGDRVYIMGGVKIGDGGVVVTGSIVTKDVAPYSIVAGIPAKIIKYRFSDLLIEKLVTCQWWTKNPNELSLFFHLQKSFN